MANKYQDFKTHGCVKKYDLNKGELRLVNRIDREFQKECILNNISWETKFKELRLDYFRNEIHDPIKNTVSSSIFSLSYIVSRIDKEPIKASLTYVPPCETSKKYNLALQYSFMIQGKNPELLNSSKDNNFSNEYFATNKPSKYIKNIFFDIDNSEIFCPEMLIKQFKLFKLINKFEKLNL